MGKYLEEGVIEEEEEVLAGLSQEVGGHVVLQLRAVHAVHAGPTSLHPIQLVQGLDDGCSSIQIPSVLSGLHYHYDETLIIICMTVLTSATTPGTIMRIYVGDRMCGWVSACVNECVCE